jgi:hypothetical protein
VLASTYCRAENVSIEALIIAELKFSDNQRQIFCANLVERADHPAFEDRQEAAEPWR